MPAFTATAGRLDCELDCAHFDPPDPSRFAVVQNAWCIVIGFIITKLVRARKTISGLCLYASKFHLFKFNMHVTRTGPSIESKYQKRLGPGSGLETMPIVNTNFLVAFFDCDDIDPGHEVCGAQQENRLPEVSRTTASHVGQLRYTQRTHEELPRQPCYGRDGRQIPTRKAQDEQSRFLPVCASSTAEAYWVCA